MQRGLKDSVVNDMCRAVVKHMVGDVYVSSSGQHGTKKVLNHLYEPVLQSVQVRILPLTPGGDTYELQYLTSCSALSLIMNRIISADFQHATRCL